MLTPNFSDSHLVAFIDRLPVAPNFGERQNSEQKVEDTRREASAETFHSPEHCVPSESRAKRVHRVLTYFSPIDYSQSFIFTNLHSLRSAVDQYSMSLRLLHDHDMPLVHDKRNLSYL